MRFLIESIDTDQNTQIQDFYQFAREKLAITDNPIIAFVPSLHTTSFGVYSPSQSSVTVATAGRHISDILRTFGHELVHHKQLTSGSELSLDELEYEANAVAGMLMRDYNKLHPEMFGVDVETDVPAGTIGDVGASHMGQDYPLTPTYEEGGIADGQPMRPPYPIEMAETVNSAGSGAFSGLGVGPTGEPGIGFEVDIDAEGDDTDWNHTHDHIHSLHPHKSHMKPHVQQRYLQQKEYTKQRHLAIRKWKDDHNSMHLHEEFLIEDGGAAVGGAPINSAGAGNVAGIGIGAHGEPGVNKKKRKTPIMTSMGRRKMPLTFNQLREQLQEKNAHVVKQIDWDEIEKHHPEEQKAIEAALKKPKSRSTTSFLKKFK